MLTNDDLLVIVEAHRADSLGVEDGELSNERALALDRYHGRPYGNEMEGRSSIVSKDLSEAVDWAMPAIMRIFTQSGTVAEFGPVSEEDEKQAEIETDYVNQVIMKDNDGWIAMHDAIKDTLLLKNGYIKHWWEVSEKIEEPKYHGLAIEELQQLMQQLQQDGCEVEIKGQEERQIMTEQGPMAIYDIELKIRRKKGRVRIEAVPCEEVRVSRKCRGSLQDSPFVEHVTRKTRSDLIELGMKRDFVEQLPAYSETSRWGSQSFSRDSVSDESRGTWNTSFNDRSMDEIEYCEAYIRVDWDDDGVAELRKVVCVGQKIPEGDEWNEPVPAVALTAFTAKRVPHRHVGESLYDELGDLQEIKTTLTRQLMDNVYLTNNNQWLVNERVNLADFMTSLPGGIKRIEGMEPVSGAVEAIQAKPIISDILPVIGYIDQVKESRTGISKASAGLDPDTLSNVTKGAYLENMNRASQKVEMITRLIAETGVKELVLQVHSLLMRYQDKQRIVRMKGKYVPVNPQEWRERTDLTVKVGLGTGTEEQRQQKLLMISGMQRDMLAPLGLVGPKEGYALFADIAKTMGFDAPDKFAMSPESPEYQQKMSQPQPPPLPVMIEQMKLQAGQQSEQMRAQADVQKFQAQSQLDQQRLQTETQLTIQLEQVKAQAKLQEVQANLELQRSNDQRDAEREQFKAAMAAQLEQSRLEFDRWKTEQDNAVKLTIASQSHEATMSGQAQAIEANAAQRAQQELGPVLEQMAGMSQQMMVIRAHQTAPRKKVRGPDGRLVGVEINGQIVPIEG